MSNWDWQVFCKSTLEGEVVAGCFGRDGDITYLDWLLSAWGWTLSVALLALVVALVVGSFIGILRTLPHKGWAFFGHAWTELFRNIPLLVQIFLWYHVLPQIFPVLKGVPSFLLVVVGLGFFTSARIAEQVRAGILALPKGYNTPIGENGVSSAATPAWASTAFTSSRLALKVSPFTNKTRPSGERTTPPTCPAASAKAYR